MTVIEMRTMEAIIEMANALEAKNELLDKQNQILETIAEALKGEKDEQ